MVRCIATLMLLLTAALTTGCATADPNDGSPSAWQRVSEWSRETFVEKAGTRTEDGQLICPYACVPPEPRTNDLWEREPRYQSPRPATPVRPAPRASVEEERAKALAWAREQEDALAALDAESVPLRDQTAPAPEPAPQPHRTQSAPPLPVLEQDEPLTADVEWPPRGPNPAPAPRVVGRFQADDPVEAPRFAPEPLGASRDDGAAGSDTFRPRPIGAPRGTGAEPVREPAPRPVQTTRRDQAEPVDVFRPQPIGAERTAAPTRAPDLQPAAPVATGRVPRLRPDAPVPTPAMAPRRMADATPAVQPRAEPRRFTEDVSARQGFPSFAEPAPRAAPAPVQSFEPEPVVRTAPAPVRPAEPDRRFQPPARSEPARQAEPQLRTARAPPVETTRPVQTRPTAQAAPSVIADGIYRLGPSDEITLSVFGEEELSGEFAVDATGTISLPLVGPLQAAGLTLREFESDLTAALNYYLINPRVQLQLTKSRPFYIFGEVEEGGEFEYVAGMHVLTAIGMAGGYTYRANKNKVFITRGESQDDAEQEFPASVETRLRPGDIVRVPERRF